MLGARNLCTGLTSTAGQVMNVYRKGLFSGEKFVAPPVLSTKSNLYMAAIIAYDLSCPNLFFLLQTLQLIAQAVFIAQAAK